MALRASDSNSSPFLINAFSSSDLGTASGRVFVLASVSELSASSRWPILSAMILDEVRGGLKLDGVGLFNDSGSLVWGSGSSGWGRGSGSGSDGIGVGG